MKWSKLTEEQIPCASAGRERHAGAHVCRRLEIKAATFYVWKKKCASLSVSELRRLRKLEDENARLKRLVAGFKLDKHILKETLRKDR